MDWKLQTDKRETKKNVMMLKKKIFFVNKKKNWIEEKLRQHVKTKQDWSNSKKRNSSLNLGKNEVAVQRYPCLNDKSHTSHKEM